MTLYFALKYLHIIGASVLLGTGAGIAFFMLLAHRTGDARVVAGVARIVVIADFLFTATAVVLQPITGLALVWNVGYGIGEHWIVLSIVLYVVTGATHAPHHTPKEWIEKFKGRFDIGWDKYREETLARQKKLGVADVQQVMDDHGGDRSA